MSERERWSAFALAAVAALCALGAALLLPWHSPSGNSERPQVGAPPPPIVLADEARRDRSPAPRRARAERHAAEDLAPGTRPSPLVARRLALARRTARRFVAALLRLEAGEASGAVRRALRATASATLVRRLLARPPRLPLGERSAPRGRVDSISALPDQRGVVELSATIARGRDRSGLLLVVREERGRWIVGALR